MRGLLAHLEVPSERWWPSAWAFPARCAVRRARSGTWRSCRAGSGCSPSSWCTRNWDSRCSSTTTGGGGRGRLQPPRSRARHRWRRARPGRWRAAQPHARDVRRSAVASARQTPLSAGVLGERAEVLAAVALVLRESRRVVAEPSLSP